MLRNVLESLAELVSLGMFAGMVGSWAAFMSSFS